MARRNRANNKMVDHMDGHKGVKFSQKTTHDIPGLHTSEANLAQRNRLTHHIWET